MPILGKLSLDKESSSSPKNSSTTRELCESNGTGMCPPLKCHASLLKKIAARSILYAHRVAVVFTDCTMLTVKQVGMHQPRL